ncbi:MAG: glycosyltransferase [Candidatus Omnitrophota bacterium]
MKKKALIFYISEFSGHFHGANAIKKGLLEIDKNIDIEMVNALEYTNPILGNIINRTYFEVIKKRPEFWGHIYDNPSVLKKTKKAREALHRYNMSKIKRLIGKYEPAVVLCTQAFPCGMVADYKKTTGSNIILIGVLTDYAPHSYWLYDEVNYYVVPSEHVGRALEKKGVPAGKIKAYGIPVDPKFGLRHDKGDVRGRLGLRREDPAILIMGGSQGIGAIEEVVKELLEDTRHNYQLLVITGKNKRLYRRLVKLAEKKEKNLKVFPYMENIDELMEVSDLIITKAGGLTTAEALVKKLPLLIMDPIPGHERMNADFLVEKGVAVELSGYENIHEEINKLFDSVELLLNMQARAGELSHPESSLDIAKLAIEGS